MRACVGLCVQACEVHSNAHSRIASGLVGALIRCFAATVLLQVMRWLTGPAQKLPLRVTEGMTKSGECVRALDVRAGVCGAFKRAFSHLGCSAL